MILNSLRVEAYHICSRALPRFRDMDRRLVSIICPSDEKEYHSHLVEIYYRHSLSEHLKLFVVGFLIFLFVLYSRYDITGEVIINDWKNHF